MIFPNSGRQVRDHRRPVLGPVRFSLRGRPLATLPADTRGSPALLQRDPRLLRPEPLRGRRAGTGGHRHVLLLPRLHPRADQDERGDAARHPDLRGSACPQHSPPTGGPGVLAAPGGRPRAEDPRVLRPLPRPAGRPAAVRPDRGAQPGDADAGHRHADRHPRGRPGRLPRPGQREDRRRGRGQGRLQRRGRHVARGARRLHRLAGQEPLRRHHDRAAQRGVRGRERRDPHADEGRGPDVRHGRRRARATRRPAG